MKHTEPLPLCLDNLPSSGFFFSTFFQLNSSSSDHISTKNEFPSEILSFINIHLYFTISFSLMGRAITHVTAPTNSHQCLHLFLLSFSMCTSTLCPERVLLICCLPLSMVPSSHPSLPQLCSLKDNFIFKAHNASLSIFPEHSEV